MEAVLAFNRRAEQERSAIRISLRTGHLESCVICDEPCVCPDLLEDPGRIFDKPTASPIHVEEAPGYFGYLGYCYGKDLCMRYDGHVINCKKGMHFKDRYKHVNQSIECACPLIVEYPERYFRIPENEWICRALSKDEERALKQEWIDLNKKDKSRAVRCKKFNILCQRLGKTYRYVKAFYEKDNDQHLNTCPFSFSSTGPDTCGCYKPFVHPDRYFIEEEENRGMYITRSERNRMEEERKGMCKIRGEKNYHRRDCNRVKKLVSDDRYGDEFPENLECDCKEEKREKKSEDKNFWGITNFWGLKNIW